MDPISNISDSWPPIFEKPPSPSLNISKANEDLFNNNFILQCINQGREKANANLHNGEANVANYLCSESNAFDLDPHYPSPKRTRLSYMRNSTKDPLLLTGILRNNNNHMRQSQHRDNTVFIIPDNTDAGWHNITTQNNKKNAINQVYWRGILALPTDLSRENRAAYCSRINDTFCSNSHWPSTIRHSDKRASRKVQFLQNDSMPPSAVHALPIEPKSSKCTMPSNIKVKRKNNAIQNDFEAIKEDLHLRAQRKITRIATWNINNGFDHLAIASIMVKKDIDILALQEPRLSNSTKDDVWIATMRKELRKSKLELITTQFSYLVFDEQTSGAALASIIRQVSNVQGRLLSVTFKTDDLWEVHTVISIYAVTNPKSTRKYANSRNSRKDVSTKLTKALYDEIIYLRETFGEAPITIVGDFQDSIHNDHRDNIGMTGKKMNPDGPLQLLVNEGFVSA